jgi:uncharacterized protein
MSDQPAPPPLLPPVIGDAPAPAQRVALGWGKALLFCLIFLSISGVSVVVSLASRSLGWQLDPGVAACIDLLFAWPITLCLACVITPIRWGDAYPFTGFPRTVVAPAIVTGLGLSLVSCEIIGWIPMPEFIEEVFRELLASHPIPRFISIVVIAPVAEEMLFRGLIFREFARRYSVPHAIVGSAALFAAFHLNPWQAVVAFPIGVVAAWLVLRTGSIVPGIVLHAALNFTSAFLVTPMGSLFGYTEEHMIEMAHLPWPMLVSGVVASTVGLVWLRVVLREGSVKPDFAPAEIVA